MWLHYFWQGATDSIMSVLVLLIYQITRYWRDRIRPLQKCYKRIK